ncbi:hypothetical protein BS78_K305300 [Paspalum vaginatum]|uniref:GDSL esterase/lipase n=1 Tax=Paspalum vaginatum TaxID=158149 RepID=A0A9W7XAE6_9POAL|nr:hypothetical protein BS78_K305300 [Paspalum vaginatum]
MSAGFFSVAGGLLLVHAVLLLLNAHAGQCGCYKRIFSFGDAMIDTGNFVQLAAGKAASSKFKEAPYGMTFFRHPTGRICDGRVLIDFYAEALQLPLIPPYVPEKDSGQFPHGANFAVYGASAMGEGYNGHNDTVTSPWPLGQQTTWFEEMLQRIAPGGNGAKVRQILAESLIVMGEIGAIDYSSWFDVGGASEDAVDVIPDVITYISHFIEEMILNQGAKAFLVPNILPMGCRPSYLSRFRSSNHSEYDENGCLRWFNDFSQKHNQALAMNMGWLRRTYPNVTFIYADYYGAAMEFISNPGRFDIGDPLLACCGGDGPYHTGGECNSTAKIWGDPAHFASWDGVQLTEKAYSIIAEGVLNGKFANPPFPLRC